MAKIQPIRDLQNSLIAPVTHERAVYDSNGAKLSGKMERLMTAEAANEKGALYNKVVIDQADYHAAPYYIVSTTGKWSSSVSGRHIVIDVTKAKFVHVTANAGNAAYFWFVSRFMGGKSSTLNPYTIGSCNIIEKGESAYVEVPSDAVGMAVTYSTTDAEYGYLNKPASITLYESLTESVEDTIAEGEDVDLPAYPVDRIMAGAEATSAVDDIVSYAVPVKAGERIYTQFAFTGDELRYGFIPTAPVVGVDVSGFSYLTVAQAYDGSILAPISGYFILCERNADTNITSFSAWKKRENIGSATIRIEKQASKVKALSDFVSPFEEIDLSQFTPRRYYIGQFGTYHSDTARHIIVPVSAGGRVRITPPEGGVSSIAWQTAEGTPGSYNRAPLVPGSGAAIPVDETTEFDVPEGAVYCYVRTLSLSGVVNTPSYFGYAKPVADADPISPASQASVISQRNPKAVYESLMLAVRYGHYNRSLSAFNSPSPTTLLWFSDLHADRTCMKNVMDWSREYGQYFDDVIATGDQLRLHFYEDWTWWHDLGGDKVLQVIGNHDSWATASQFKASDYPGLTFEDMVQGMFGSTYSIIKQKYVYDKLFAPVIDSWNVVQPTDAAQNGYCYYYKDYDAVRLIVLDCMHYCRSDDWEGTLATSKQHAWLIETLEGARQIGKPVVIATHMSPAHGISYLPVPCAYNTTDYTGELTSSDVTRNAKDAVSDFILAGGEFVCWIIGHVHTNMLYTINTGTETEQFVALLTCDSATNPTSIARGSAGIRVAGTKTEDAFNVITFDTVRKLIKIVRIGANINDKMEEATKIVYRYANATDDWGNPLAKGLVMCQ